MLVFGVKGDVPFMELFRMSRHAVIRKRKKEGRTLRCKVIKSKILAVGPHLIFVLFSALWPVHRSSVDSDG